MKRLKIFTVISMVCYGMLAVAQDDDQKIVVEITKEIDGEKKTFKGEYDSPEEMRADPHYQEFAGEDDNTFWFDADDDDIVVHLGQIKDMQKNVFRFFDSEDGDNGFFFHFDDDESKVFDFDLSDFDSEEFAERMEELGVGISKSFEYSRSNNSDKNAFESKRIRVSDVEDEFGKRGKVSNKALLKLEDLSFSPSYNGKLKIRFETPVEDELSIKVSNLDDKDIFSRYFESYSGLYSETIDLSGQKEGIYLLEIILGDKKLTRKVIIN